MYEKYQKALEQALADGPTSRIEATRIANQYMERPIAPSSWRSAFRKYTELNDWINDQLEEIRATGEIPYTIEGVMPEDLMPDPQSVLEKVSQLSRKEKELQDRRDSQTIKFSKPYCVVFMSDTHIDNTGTDIDRLMAETETVLRMPNTGTFFLGDLTDNFIAAWCRGIMMQNPVTIPEAHALGKMWLEKISPKLLGVVGGNHDFWSKKEAGIDVLGYTLAGMQKSFLYDPDEIYVTLEVMGRPFVLRLRHQFRGSSIYNPTHAIERASKFDQGRGFDIGVQGHTHASGVARHFNNGGKTGLAILCGAYKRRDKFAKRLGFPEANDDTAIAVVLHPEWGATAFQNLEAAEAFMKSIE